MMSENIRKIILECLDWYFNGYYGGEPITGWTWGMIAAIAKADGVTNPEDFVPHVEALLKIGGVHNA
jgi:hypothetical protein